MAGKLIIFSAPSGSGKSTIINHLLKQNLNLHFSISATSRAPRGTEQNGVEYYFLTPDEFLFDGIGTLGLLDDAAVILGAVLTVFFPDGD